MVNSTESNPPPNGGGDPRGAPVGLTLRRSSRISNPPVRFNDYEMDNPKKSKVQIEDEKLQKVKVTSPTSGTGGAENKEQTPDSVLALETPTQVQLEAKAGGLTFVPASQITPPFI